MSAEAQTRHGTAKTITTSDTVLQSYSAIYVGGAGNVRVIMESGDDVIFTAPPVGTILPVRVKQVMATNTTATLLIGLL